MNEWISVEDRLPETKQLKDAPKGVSHSDIVDVKYENGLIEEGRIRDGLIFKEWFTRSSPTGSLELKKFNIGGFKVTHWKNK